MLIKLMLSSKSILYTMFAVALGYFLISYVPLTVSPKEREMLAAPVEDKVFEGSEPAVEKDEKPADSSESLDRGLEVSAPTRKSSLQETLQYGVWVIDLFVALGVYFLVKRRFT